MTMTTPALIDIVAFIMIGSGAIVASANHDNVDKPSNDYYMTQDDVDQMIDIAAHDAAVDRTINQLEQRLHIRPQ